MKVVREKKKKKKRKFGKLNFFQGHFSSNFRQRFKPVLFLSSSSVYLITMPAVLIPFYLAHVLLCCRGRELNFIWCSDKAMF